jgi:hypothetical protein
VLTAEGRVHADAVQGAFLHEGGNYHAPRTLSTERPFAVDNPTAPADFAFSLLPACANLLPFACNYSLSSGILQRWKLRPC